MKKIKNKVIMLLTMVFATLAMKTTAYADADFTPAESSSKMLFPIFIIIIIVCIFAFIVLKKVRNKK